MDQQTIHLLPEHVANQIAAGEVVQRPESVVKELVENALDAGASEISVLVREGGKSLIHVIDNGSGMTRADLTLVLKRHATSKIQSLEDLHRLQSLGFRGEALAAIASVAEVEIITQRPQDIHGWRLISQPLKQEHIEPATSAAGTQVIVRNLFFNVPARRKFLRSDITELRHISETVLRYGLSYPEKSWTFHDGSGTVFQVKSHDLLDRIATLLGNAVAESVIPVHYESELVRIEGYLGLPTIARTTKATQFLFLNHRPIVNRALVHAIYQGYEHLLEKTEHPLFIVFLWIDPQHVDVNIHPQKHEVKFDDDRALYHAVLEATLQSLRHNYLIPELRLQQAEVSSPLVSISVEGVAAPLVVNRTTGEIVDSARTQESARERYIHHVRTELPRWQPISQKPLTSLLTVPEPSTSDQQALITLKAPQMWQMHYKYIFVQSEDGMIIIDQHIAHERILYERALKAMEQASDKRTQRLMFPVEVELNLREIAIYQELEDDLHRLGFDSHLVADGNRVVISGVPEELRSGTEATALREILEQFAENQVIRPASARDNLAASFACRAAIKAGDPLTLEQMQHLVHELFQTATPEVCPHGRPVMIHFPLRELDRRFGRTS